MYSTNTRQKVSSSSELNTHTHASPRAHTQTRPSLLRPQRESLRQVVNEREGGILWGVLTYTHRSATQLATKGLGSMFSWQDRKGKKSRALHFSMASCEHTQTDRHTHRHIDTHTYIHTYTHTHTDTHIYTHTSTHTHILRRTHTHIHRSTQPIKELDAQQM